jgi:hypothetical protein
MRRMVWVAGAGALVAAAALAGMRFIGGEGTRARIS